MVAASGVVLSNLMYVVGALLLMIVIIAVIVLRQRKPKSVEANMESFNRGLRALAPDAPTPGRGPVPAASALKGGTSAENLRQSRTVAGRRVDPSTETGTG